MRADEILRTIERSPHASLGFASELVRQMVQLRKSGVTTGTAWRKMANLLHEWLKSALSVLKRAAKDAVDGKLGHELQEAIRLTESKLAGLGRIAFP